MKIRDKIIYWGVHVIWFCSLAGLGAYFAVWLTDNL